MPYKFKKSPKFNKKRAGLYRVTRASRKTSTREYFAKKRKLKTRFLFLTILIILLFILGIYILFFTSVFQIKNVEIVFDNEPYLVSQNEIKNTIYTLMNKKYLYFLSHNNLLLFNSGRLKDIINQDSRIASLSINKKLFPTTIKVKIRESRPAAQLLILGGSDDLYLNPRGQVIMPPENRGEENLTTGDFAIFKKSRTDSGDFATIKESRNNLPFTTLKERSDNDDRYFATPEGRSNNTPSTTLNLDTKSGLPLFFDQTSTSLNDPDIIELFKNTLDFIKSDVLIQNNINVNLVEINKQANVYNIRINTSEKWYIMINSETDFDKQLSSLGLIIKDKPEIRQKLKYIDLRFGERIFYKINSTEKNR